MIFDSLPVDAIARQVGWGIYTPYLFRCANYYRHRVGTYCGVSSNESMAVGGGPAAMVDAAGGGGEEEGGIARILVLNNK